jgi:hypothetical protein
MSNVVTGPRTVRRCESNDSRNVWNEYISERQPCIFPTMCEDLSSLCAVMSPSHMLQVAVRLRILV